MKLCFNTIACRNEEDRLLEIIAELAGLGEYQAVELWMPDIDKMDREKARDLAALCAERQLDLPIVTSVLGVLRLEMDDLDQQLKLCRKLATLAEWLGARLRGLAIPALAVFTALAIGALVLFFTDQQVYEALREGGIFEAIKVGVGRKRSANAFSSMYSGTGSHCTLQVSIQPMDNVIQDLRLLRFVQDFMEKTVK